MNYTHLGRTGLKVSRLCLGTMNFGDVTDEKTSARILDEALEAGINFIDTADVYGRTTPASASRNDSHAIRRHHELSRRNLARPRGRSAPGLCLVMTKLMNPFFVIGSSSL